MKRQQASSGASSSAACASADGGQPPRPAKRPKVERRERDTKGLHVLRSTLRCAHGGCVPCSYKLVLHAPPAPAAVALQQNQRPEMCPRAALTAAPAPTPGDPRRRCGLYDDRMHVLTVGDGDFSFSLALARALCPEGGGGPAGGGGLVATSHESAASVLSVYPNAAETLAELKRRGVAVFHDVDATDLQSTLPAHSLPQGGAFHRVVWNFPCVGRGLDPGVPSSSVLCVFPTSLAPLAFQESPNLTTAMRVSRARRSEHRDGGSA